MIVQAFQMHLIINLQNKPKFCQNYRSFFAEPKDPCPGTYKYTVVTYDCGPNFPLINTCPLPPLTDIGEGEQRDLYNFNGRWLFVDRTQKTLAEAKTECERRNMALAQFGNAHEYDAVKSIFSASGKFLLFYYYYY